MSGPPRSPRSSKTPRTTTSMMHPSKFLAIAGIVSLNHVAALKDVEDLFQVDFTTNENGGCQWVGKDNLNRMLADTLVLAKRGVELMDNYEAAVLAIERGDKTQFPEARRLVQRLFAPRPINGPAPGDGADYQQNRDYSDTARARVNYKMVVGWLELGGRYDWSVQFLRASEQPKPNLFCDGDWVENIKKPRGQLYGNVPWSAYDDFASVADPQGRQPFRGGTQNGDFVLLPNGANLKLADVQPWVDNLIKIVARRLGVSEGAMRLFYSKVHHRYFVAFGGASVDVLVKNWRESTFVADHCRSPKARGDTQLATLEGTRQLFAAMTICPGGFDYSPQRDWRSQPVDKATWRYQGLAGPVRPEWEDPSAPGVPEPLPGGEIRAIQYSHPQTRNNVGRASEIDHLLSSCATLFHELFHLVLGAKDSHPPNMPGRREAISFEACVGERPPVHGRPDHEMSADQRLRNPQTYVLAAYAYHYTMSNAPALGPNGDQERVEFFAGRALRGVDSSYLQPRSYNMAWTKQPMPAPGTELKIKNRADDICAVPHNYSTEI